MEKRLNQGVLCISLDFELHWGSFQSKKLNARELQKFQNTRKVIPEILSIFDEFNIRATWATVGMLFNENKVEWETSLPEDLPTYHNQQVSSYNWIEKNGFFSEKDDFHFAPDLIKEIASHSNMEIATHTYSHYYCQQPGQTSTHFKEDMNMAINKARKFGMTIKSLVFPRNEFNKNYLQICNDIGIKSVRSNPSQWYWNLDGGDTFLKRIVRLIDCFIRLDKTTCVLINDIKKESNQPLLIPASRFFRPWSGVTILNKLRMKRILDEMTLAAIDNRFYHLWWHPENFGDNPKKSLQDLRIILKHFAYLKNQYDMTSLNMDDVYNLICVNN